MDFAAALSSDSMREQSGAAIFLRSQGADGADHLDALLRCCMAVKTGENSTLDKYEETLLGYSTETTWELFWQGQMTLEIGVTLGSLALTGLVSLGSLFLLLALIPWRKRSVDSDTEV